MPNPGAGGLRQSRGARCDEGVSAMMQATTLNSGNAGGFSAGFAGYRILS
jgi:hypothetical protein